MDKPRGISHSQDIRVSKRTSLIRLWNYNQKGEGLVATLIALGLLGLFISVSLFMTQSVAIQEKDSKNSAGIISKFKEVQVTLGPRNGACGENFGDTAISTGKTFQIGDTEIPALTKLDYDNHPTPALLDTNPQVTFEKGVRTSRIQLVDLFKLTDDNYSANLLIEFTKPSGQYVGPEKYEKKIPVYLWVTPLSATTMKIIDCGTAPDIDKSEKVALCLSMISSGVEATWDPVNQQCLYAQSGACGPANGGTFSTEPSGVANLCNLGTPSAPPYGPAIGPWDWQCMGTNGGPNSNCHANTNVVVGACGPKNGMSSVTAPTNPGLCSAGTASAVGGAGPWTWTCFGANGGGNDSCMASSTVTDGACGAAQGQTFATAPTSNLCSAGSASAVIGSWSWQCNGINGGITASCTANTTAPPPPTNGVCGSDNGGTFWSAPSAGLCSAGSPSGVFGGGPWDWSCVGSGGGTTASCHAQAYYCEQQNAPNKNFNSWLILWKDKKGNNTGAYAYCLKGSSFTPPAPMVGACTGTLLSSTQCDIPHSQNNNGWLKNGATVRCCLIKL